MFPCICEIKNNRDHVLVITNLHVKFHDPIHKRSCSNSDESSGITSLNIIEPEHANDIYNYIC